MKNDGRYDVSGLIEAQFEPGSNEQVLKNRLGITSPQTMDDIEARALGQSVLELIGNYDGGIDLPQPISARSIKNGWVKFTIGQVLTGR